MSIPTKYYQNIKMGVSLLMHKTTRIIKKKYQPQYRRNNTLMFTIGNGDTLINMVWRINN